MISICKPTPVKNEKNFVMECLDNNWIGPNGKFCKGLEKQFKDYCNVKYASVVNSGTAALHLGLLSLGIGKGDEVICPDFTMIACTNSIIYTGAIPVFVDADLNTWNMDVNKIEEKITNKTKAIMVVDIYGNPNDADKINEIAKKHNLKVINDACESFGADYKGKKVGSLYDVTCFSLYSNKTVQCGNGGVIVTDDEKIDKKCKLLRDHAFEKPRFIHNEIGYNYKLTDIQAAIAVAQMNQADKLVKARINNAKLYNEQLKDIKGITLPPDCLYGTNVHWMYGILVDKEVYGMDKDSLMEVLKRTGIETRSFFYPSNKQPVYQKMKNIECKGKYPISDILYEKGLYLPSSSNLTQIEINKVCEAIKSFSK